MTTIGQLTATCAVCGTVSPQAVVSSPTTHGSPDLDSRPAEPLRSTLAHLVGMCPACGYAGEPSLKMPSESWGAGSLPWVKELVAGARYRRQRADTSYPELANRFLCRMLVEETVGAHAHAGCSALHAAWACDDAAFAAEARFCRELAVELWREGRDEGDEFDSYAKESAMIADTLRLAGRFRDAIWEAEHGLASEPEEPLDQILGYLLELAQRRDAGRHTCEEAVSEEWEVT